MRNRRGSIVSVLVVSTLVVGSLFLAATFITFLLGLRGRTEASVGARRLSEACAQAAVARLIRNPSLDPTSLPVIRLSLPSYAGGEGLVAFATGEANAAGIPVSTNNLRGRTAVRGWGSTVVGPQTACLVAVGRYQGAEARHELVLNVPAFPYVVASSVPVRAVDGLSVFGVKNVEALRSGFASVSADDKTPGHLMTSAGDAGGVASLRLSGAGTHIEGDAQAGGSVVVSGGAKVDGETRPYAQGAPLPKLNMTVLDPSSSPGNSAIMGDRLGSSVFTGFHSRQGDLEVTGGLELRSAVLFVRGDLTIRGGLRGKGAILATGSVTLEGGGVLHGDSQAAVIAGGAVTLRGTPSQRTELRGMVYTEGDLDCRFANIAGAIVVNNPDPAGHAYLEQVTLAESSSISQVSFVVNSTVTVPGSGETLPTYPYIGIDYGPFGFQTVSVKDADAPDGPDYPASPSMGANWEVVQFDPDHPKRVPPGFPARHEWTEAEPWVEIGMPTVPDDPVELIHGHLGAGFPKSLGLPRPPGAHQPDWFPVWGVNVGAIFPQGEYSSTAALRAAMEEGLAPTGPRAWPHADLGDPSAVVDAVLARFRNDIVQTLPAAVQAFNDTSRFYARAVRGPDGRPIVPPMSQDMLVPWSLDLSDFVKLSDSIRIVSWRRI